MSFLPRLSGGVALLPALLTTLLLTSQAHATDPRPPVQLADPGTGFLLQLVLDEGIPASAVSVSRVFNRYAGTMVDAGAQSVDGKPVRRQLAIQTDAQLGLVVNAFPVFAGESPLPDGVYSQFLELELQPGSAPGRVLYRARRTVHFTVKDGVVQRVSMLNYSGLLERPVQQRAKTGELVPVFKGAIEARTLTPINTGDDSQQESGHGMQQESANESNEP